MQEISVAGPERGNANDTRERLLLARLYSISSRSRDPKDFPHLFQQSRHFTRRRDAQIQPRARFAEITSSVRRAPSSPTTARGDQRNAPKQHTTTHVQGPAGSGPGGRSGGKLQQRRLYHWGVAGSGKERDGNLRRRRFTFCTPLPPDGHGGCDDEASHGIPKRTYLRACATCVVHALRDEGNRTGKRRGEVGKRGRGEGERGHNLV